MSRLTHEVNIPRIARYGLTPPDVNLLGISMNGALTVGSIRSGWRSWGAGALAASLIAGLLLGAQGGSAHALTLPVDSSHALPERPARMDVGADGTIYATLPTEIAIAIEPRGVPGDLGRIIELPGTAKPFDIAVTADGATAYVSRTSPSPDLEGSIERVDLPTGEVAALAGLGTWVTDVQLTADDATLVVASPGDQEVVLIDTASDEVRARVTVPSQPLGLAVANGIAYVGGSPFLHAMM